MPTPTLQSLEQFVDVETPEQVVFSYTIAGIGSRAAAALLDYPLIGVLWVGLLLSFAPFVRRVAPAPWVLAILTVFAFVLFWGYYVLFEGLWDGQTPGKRQFGLRVVRDGGYSITFGASAVRNLVRVIDLIPGTYGIGLISVAISPTGKRLGDYAAGTIVVRERAVVATAGALPVAGADTSAAGTSVVATAALTDDEFALLDRFIARRGTLDADRRAQLAEELAVRFRDRAPDLAGSDGAVLMQLFERERVARARGAAGRNDRGAAREQHAIVAQGTPRWRQFATLLASVQRRGLAHVSEAEISDFVARYRELAGDLARLQTAVRGRRIDSVFYLSRLVAGGHNLLYQERRLTASAVWHYLTRTVPQEIRRSALPIGIAVVLLFGPAAIAWVAVVRDPAVAAEFIPQGMIDRAEDGVQRAKRDEGYIPDFGELRPVTASAIMTNNVTITYAAFAGGILVGLGTIFVLVSNGISLGGVMGLYQSKGILEIDPDLRGPAWCPRAERHQHCRRRRTVARLRPTAPGSHDAPRGADRARPSCHQSDRGVHVAAHRRRLSGGLRVAQSGMDIWAEAHRVGAHRSAARALRQPRSLGSGVRGQGSEVRGQRPEVRGQNCRRWRGRARPVTVRMRRR